jgi:hypothetical protein
VKLSIAKPEDESPWASGYQVDLLFGPDAVGYNPSVVNGNDKSDVSIKQAYVTLRAPVGNGIDFKVGVFDSPLGYEAFDGNPNYTRSYGYAIEPTELTGLQASYKFCDAFSLSGGIANTEAAGINNRNADEGLTKSVWHKAYFGSATLTAPSSWGWLSGSALTGGVLYGAANNYTTAGGEDPGYQGGNQLNYYAGLTLNTPLKELTVGAAFDYARNLNGGNEFEPVGVNGDGNPVYATYDTDVLAVGLYATYKATDKLSFNARGEYAEADDYTGNKYSGSVNVVEVTGTVEYDLWANVISRVEVRWDQNLSGGTGTEAGYVSESGPVTERDSVGLYANVIYKF